MKIEKLVISNFKSYQGVHVIGPFDDFVAVIGSNASGKSNCFDAICFVLAAPASAMRCKDISELICKNNDTIDSASVEMTIQDNYEEIVFKRKITYNSSSYYVNGRKISATDYKDALNNVGFHNRYQSYILFQGEIGALASMSPKSITKLIEELSGSIEYKEEYDSTEKELNKLKDVIESAEESRLSITERYKEAKQEAKIVKQYNDLESQIKTNKKEYHMFIVSQTSMKYQETSNEIAKNDDELNSVKEESERFEDALRNIDESINAAKYIFKEAEKKTQKAIKENNQLITDLKVAESREIEAKNKIDQLSKASEDSQLMIKEKNKEMKNLQSEVKSFQQKNQEKLNNRAELLNVFEEIKRNSSNDPQIHEYEKINAEISLVSTNIVQNKEQLNNLHKELDNIQRMSLDEPVEPQKPEIKEELSNIIEEKEKELSEAKQKVVSSSKNAMKEQIITEMQQKIKGIHGFLVQNISSHRQKYDSAVSAALSKYSNLIVVQSLDIISKCISFMNSSGYSGLSFISLDLIQTVPDPERIEGLIPILNFISVSDEFKPVIAHLLRNYYFTEDPIIISSILNKNPNFIIIDQFGTMYSHNGKITCGIYDSLQKRTKSVSALQKEIEKLKTQNKKIIDSNTEETRRYNDLMSKYEKDLKEKNDHEMQINSLNQQISMKEKQVYDQEIYQSELQSKLDVLKSKFSNSNSNFYEKYQNLFDLMGAKTNDEYIDHYNSFIEEEKINIQNNAKIEYISSIIEIEKAKNMVDEIKNAKKSLKSIKEESTKIQQNLETSEKNLREMNEDLNTKQGNFSRAQQQKKDLNKKASNSNKKLRELEEKANKLLKSLSSSKDKINDHLAETDFTSLEEILAHDFSDDLPTHLCGKLSQHAINSAISKYEKEIENLIQEKEKLQPNFASETQLQSLKLLKTEAENKITDLRKSQKSLKDKFNEVKKKRLNVFKEAFEKVQNSLDQFYPALTSIKSQPLGGNAFLTPDNVVLPFAGGISYAVVPPHKRNRNVQNLSGGEQTLAVLALSFALSTVKPAPLFVLDEIDAALDVRNVAAVSNFLLSMCHRQQVIIVSHKPGVFSNADLLVGIARVNGISTPFFLPLVEKHKQNEDEPLESFIHDD